MTNPTVYTGTPIQLQWPAGSTRPLPLDLSAQAVPAWQPGVVIAANALIRPTNANESADGEDNTTGFWYQNGASAGMTSADEPGWVTTGTVKDGSLTWTPVAPSGALSGIDTVSAVIWAASGGDGQITLSNQSTTQLTATADAKPVTRGQTYTVLATVTMSSGLIYPVTFYITAI